MRKLLKSGASGVGGYVLDMTSLVLLVELLAMPVGPAAFLSAGVGAIGGFLATKFWAFRDPTPIGPRQVIAYGLSSLGTATIVAFLVHWMAMAMPYPLAKFVASVITFLVWSYPAQYFLVFANAAGGPRYAAAATVSRPFDEPFDEPFAEPFDEDA